MAVLAMCAFAAPVSAFWVEGDATIGDGGYKATRLAGYGIADPNSILGVELATYKAPKFSDVVYTVRMPWYVTMDNSLNFFRLFFYPGTKSVDNTAAGFVNKTIFSLYGKPGAEFSSSFALGVGSAFQITKDNSYGTSIPELCYTLDYNQDYFGQFNFLLKGAAFQYFSRVHGNTFTDISMDQSELADLGIMAATLDFPQWSAGLQFTRFQDDTKSAAMYLGYNYVTFVTDVPAINSLGAGMRIKIMDNAFFNFDYNWIAQGSYSIRNYYKVLVKFGF
jgi:hypothetical protein